MSSDIIITEKSSQARDVRTALGTRYGPILPAEGHLIMLREPEEVNPEWKRWTPVLLRPEGLFGTKPAPGGNKPRKLKAIKDALRSASRVWLATDCDREGQLIGQEILEHYHYRGQVMRVLFTAQDPQTIRDAFERAKPKAQFALALHINPGLRSVGCVEAIPRCRDAAKFGEMEPAQVAAEIFSGHPAPMAQEVLQPAVQAVDGLNVQFAADPLAGRLVEHLMGDFHLGGAVRQSLPAIGDQQSVFAEDRIEHRLDGVAAIHRQHGADDVAVSVRRHQDRRLLMGQAPLRGFPAAFARLAVR